MSSSVCSRSHAGAGMITGAEPSSAAGVTKRPLVIATGIRPNVGLAQRAGLTVERAIVTDDHMRSIDDDDIYVVGECAQYRGQVYGLVARLWEQAKVLADRLTGADTSAAYHGSRVATKQPDPGGPLDEVRAE